MKISIKFVLTACAIVFSTAAGVGRATASTDVPTGSAGTVAAVVTDNTGTTPLQSGEHCCPANAPYHDEGDHSCWRTADACAHHGGGDHHEDCHYDPCGHQH